MSDPISTSSRSNAPIVITKEEANSRRVDDLIKRQMSLRGEGVSVEPPRRWYNQNWLLFMIVGAIFSAGGWMIVEPWFDDYHYTQGIIESINTEDVLDLGQAPKSSESFKLLGFGSVKIRGQKIWIHPFIHHE